jgi:hypothetical protein
MVKKPGNEITSGGDSVGNDVEALTEAIEHYRSFPTPLVLVVLREMFSRGIIDSERVDDIDYLRSVILENFDEIVPDVEMLTAIHNNFLDVAEYAIDADKPAVAVVLVATAIEHILNLHYRDLLMRKGMDQKEVKSVIRSTRMEAKTGWLMALAGFPPLPTDLRKRILDLATLRNCIVHYKAKPTRLGSFEEGWDRLKQQLEDLDLDDVLDIPDELEQVLSSALIKLDPNLQLAVRVYETAIDTQTKIEPCR